MPCCACIWSLDARKIAQDMGKSLNPMVRNYLQQLTRQQQASVVHCGIVTFAVLHPAEEHLHTVLPHLRQQRFQRHTLHQRHLLGNERQVFRLILMPTVGNRR